MQQQQQEKTQDDPQPDHEACRPMIDEADQLEDFERATHEIMGVFNDPIFEKMDQEV